MLVLDHVESSIPEIATCPYLGMADDPHTCLAYPSEWNLCHHAQPVSLIRLDHQRKTCLSSRHIVCPVYQNKLVEPLPKRLRVQRTLAIPKKINLLIMAMLLVGFVAGWVWLSLH